VLAITEKYVISEYVDILTAKENKKWAFQRGTYGITTTPKKWYIWSL